MAYWFELLICSCRQMIDGVFFLFHATVPESISRFQFAIDAEFFFIAVKDSW